MDNVTLIFGDSHIRPVKRVVGEDATVWPISGATMSGARNPNSQTQSHKIVMRALDAQPTSKLVFCFGEVDVGFLIPVKSESLKQPPESLIGEAVERYGLFLNQLRQERDCEIYIGNILPPIQKDFWLKRSRIRLRQQVLITLEQRAALVDQANSLLERLGFPIINIHNSFSSLSLQYNPYPIDPRDHHYRHSFAVRAYSKAFSECGIEFRKLSHFEAAVLDLLQVVGR